MTTYRAIVGSEFKSAKHRETHDMNRPAHKYESGLNIRMQAEHKGTDPRNYDADAREPTFC